MISFGVPVTRDLSLQDHGSECGLLLRLFCCRQVKETAGVTGADFFIREERYRDYRPDVSLCVDSAAAMTSQAFLPSRLCSYGSR